MASTLIKKITVSGIISSAIILLFYGVEKISNAEHPMFFFDLSIATISLLLLVACFGMLIGKLFRIFNTNYGIFAGTFALLNLLILLATYDIGASKLYYLVLFANIFVFFTMVLAVYYSLKNAIK
jgi:hypothetical protein